MDDRSDGTTNGTVSGGYSYTKSTYNDGTGRLLMEKWIIQGLRHAWSGSPTPGPFTDPKGPNASEEMWRFFQDVTRIKVKEPGKKIPK